MLAVFNATTQRRIVNSRSVRCAGSRHRVQEFLLDQGLTVDEVRIMFLLADRTGRTGPFQGALEIFWLRRREHDRYEVT
jgi:hypothetical protein